MNVFDFKSHLIKSIELCSSQETIEKIIFDFFVNKPIPSLNSHHPFLARARINENGEVFNNTKQLSYNPDTSKIKLQRANYLGQQVFYGAVPSDTNYSDCQTTALIETCREHVRNHSIAQAYMTISKWNINRPLKVSILPFSLSSCTKNQDFNRANQNIRKIVSESFLEKDIEAQQYFIDSLKFISDIFCEINNKEKCYPISAAYYNVIQKFFKNKNILLDGLLYPSANTEASGMNIVLRKELADDGTLNLDTVVMMTMKRNPSNPKMISFPINSDEQKPNEKGDFYFKHIW